MAEPATSRQEERAECDDPVVRIEAGGQATELIAERLEQLVEAAQQLLGSGLTFRAIVVLLHDRTGIGKRQIEAVLDALPELREYLAE